MGIKENEKGKVKREKTGGKERGGREEEGKR